MSHLLRVELPDVPGSLGTVASAIGVAGGNIEAIEIVEHRSDGSAVDDIFLELPPGVMPDMVVSAVQRLLDVRVLWVSRYAAAGNLHLDLEAVELITQAPVGAAEKLTEILPGTFRSDWALTATSEGPSGLKVLSATPGAPDLPAECLDWFPLQRASRAEAPAAWSSTVVAVAPLGSADRVVMFGRRGGPEILDSELARLGHIAALTASVEAAAEGSDDTGV